MSEISFNNLNYSVSIVKMPENRPEHENDPCQKEDLKMSANSVNVA